MKAMESCPWGQENGVWGLCELATDVSPMKDDMKFKGN